MIPQKNSIATKLLKTVFSVYLIITFTVTLLHMITEYLHTRNQVIIELQRIESVFHPMLSRALWEMNFKQVRSALKGLERLPAVIGFQVEDNNGHSIAKAGRIIKSDGTSVFITQQGDEVEPNDITGLFWHEFNVIFQRGDKPFNVGKVRIYSSEAVVFSKVALGFFFLIINAIIKTIALWFIFLYVFRRILLRPLSDLTTATREINMDNLEKVIIDVKTSPKNELKALETAFNDMIAKLLSARQRLSDFMRKETAKLESLVAERTRELSLSEAKHRRSEAELQALFASMTDVIIVLSREGRYLKIAPTSPNLLYKPSNELLHKTLHEVFPEEKANHFLSVIQRCLDQKATLAIDYELIIDEKKIWFDGRVSPISENAVIFVARDISERRQWEIDMEKSKQHAEIANRAKSQFIANMSHELRTPLNAIIGFSSILFRSQNLNPAEKKNIKIIRHSGEHLLTLVNEILELSKIEAGKLVIPAMVARLREATELSDAYLIEKITLDIQIKNAALAEILSNYAENFAYDAILSLIQKVEEQETHI